MSSSLPQIQTTTPHQLASLPRKDDLVKESVGKPLEALRTPAFVIDRAVFAENCARMHKNALQWGAGFRAHLKTHKTAEGTRLQMISTANKTDKVIVSTLMEAWEVVNAGLVKDGTVKDLLYGLPVAVNKIADLSALKSEFTTYGGDVCLMIDHPQQILALQEFEQREGTHNKWPIFIKVDGGQRRAGVVTSLPAFESLLKVAFDSPVITVRGFYCHAGNAYASTSSSEASSFLSSEVEAVNTAAELALAFLKKDGQDVVSRPRFVLSVGSTPTAHAATAETRARLSSVLHGDLELHAGNYPMLDLQQLNTSMINRPRIAQRVLATVVSHYPGRGSDGSDEYMCDAGAIAMSKDSGPITGYGDVIGMPWRLGRISQEHGTLTTRSLTEAETLQEERPTIGGMVQIVGQHACLIAAAYPWYYVVDSDEDSSSNVVKDVWVPWKGW